jgi:hypothetical protein
MNDTNRYTLMIDALNELAPEIEASRSARRSGTSPLSAVLSGQGSMPQEALFLGVAQDGIPVLLNLQDPVPGPILIAGDEGSGKTALLKIIARAVDQMHLPQDVQYGVISAHPEDWVDIPPMQNCVEVFPSYQKKAGEFLASLTAWAHSNRGEKQSVLLMIDDLDVITRMDFDARQNLRWLLLRGPARRVWPIITVNSKNTEAVRAWLEFFHTRFFGSIRDENHRRFLSGSLDGNLKSLRSGREFAMREGADWLKFWIPALD